MNHVHLELKNVSKAVFRKVNNTRVKTQILGSLDLKVNKGELVTIMGASGSGKTTLLRMINRLSEIDSGIILLNGNDIRSHVPMELRRKIGMVFQVPVVFKGSVRDNLVFGIKLWEGNTGIETLSRDAGIPENLLDADAGQLSIGEKQRVCIARALANQPEVLLLDEPTSSLDAVSAQKIEKLLLDLQKERDLTILWVTHEKERVEPSKNSASTPGIWAWPSNWWTMSSISPPARRPSASRWAAISAKAK
jgi:putative ABC transport system ATP-binding protein